MKEEIMKKSIAILMLLGLTFGGQTLYAAEGGDSTLSFWEKLRKRIEMLAPQKKVNATTAVGGVRGAQVSADDTYWKGEKAKAIDPDELAAFKKAMALAESGEMKQAQAAFTEFVKKTPDSPLRKDADLALAQLKSAQ